MNLEVIAHIEALFRYPVKSMAGERLDTAHLGWHGLDGDRRHAVRRVNDRGDFPWLSASKLPDLLRFTPQGDRVRTPDGDEFPIFSDELAADIARRHGAPVQVMQMKHGVFDDGSVSVIATDTADEITRLAGVASDIRRFRPNVVVRLLRSGVFQEDAWVGGSLSFGDDGPAIAVTTRDERCSMVNLDPDSAASFPEVMKAVVRANGNYAGVYATVTRTGTLAVGQAVYFTKR